MSVQSLYKGKFVELKCKKEKEYNYEYLHEHRCNGEIVAILPYHLDRGILVRHEFTPCWGNELYISSITGGWEKDKHETPIDTVLEELQEEAGIILHDENNIFTLGTCRGTKSSDTLYHLFLVDLTLDDFGEIDIETDGSYLEGKAHNEWQKATFDKNEIPQWLKEGSDPILYTMYTRWMLGFMEKPISRKNYK